jgi:hypothetical protein
MALEVYEVLGSVDGGPTPTSRRYTAGGAMSAGFPVKFSSGKLIACINNDTAWDAIYMGNDYSQASAIADGDDVQAVPVVSGMLIRAKGKGTTTPGTAVGVDLTSGVYTLDSGSSNTFAVIQSVDADGNVVAIVS